MTTQTQHIYKLDSGESLEATSGHPFYIQGKGWNVAANLKVGDALQLHNGITLVIKTVETSTRVGRVYNFAVASNANYFVGMDGVLVHNGCAKRNAHLAGKTHPKTGIPFDKDGYPDFSSVSKKDVKIKLTGDRKKDANLANEKAGYTETPKGNVWHHHQDGTTMQLVPKDIHGKTGHDGGFAGSRRR
jgi:intein/homing endonuclease